MLQGSWERTHGDDRNWDRYNNMELLFQTVLSIIVDVLCVTGWFFVVVRHPFCGCFRPLSGCFAR